MRGDGLAKVDGMRPYGVVMALVKGRADSLGVCTLHSGRRLMVSVQGSFVLYDTSVDLGPMCIYFVEGWLLMRFEITRTPSRGE